MAFRRVQLLTLSNHGFIAWAVHILATGEEPQQGLSRDLSDGHGPGEYPGTIEKRNEPGAMAKLVIAVFVVRWLNCRVEDRKHRLTYLLDKTTAVCRRSGEA
jgi:hypothetical protein